MTGDIGERHPISQVENNQDGQQHSVERSRTAENAHPTQQHNGDDVEFEAQAYVTPDRPEPGGELVPLARQIIDPTAVLPCQRPQRKQALFGVFEPAGIEFQPPKKKDDMDKFLGKRAR